MGEGILLMGKAPGWLSTKMESSFVKFYSLKINGVLLMRMAPDRLRKNKES